MRRPVVLHPYLLAVYPILALLAHNIGWSPPSEAVRAFVISLAGAALAFFLLRLMLRDPMRAGLLTSLGLLLFFSYGHLYGLMKASEWGATIGRHRYLAPAFAVTFLVAAWLILRRLREARPLTSALNWMSAMLVAFPLVTLSFVALQPPPRPQPPASPPRPYISRPASRLPMSTTSSSTPTGEGHIAQSLRVRQRTVPAVPPRPRLLHRRCLALQLCPDRPVLELLSQHELRRRPRARSEPREPRASDRYGSSSSTARSAGSWKPWATRRWPSPRACPARRSATPICT